MQLLYKKEHLGGANEKIFEKTRFFFTFFTNQYWQGLAM